MTRYSREIIGYAVALFVCYGVFVGVGLGLVVWSRLFLFLGVAAALAVIVLDTTWAGVLTSASGVTLCCALAFAAGWGLSQVLLCVGGPAGVLGPGGSS